MNKKKKAKIKITISKISSIIDKFVEDYRDLTNKGA